MSDVVGITSHKEIKKTSSKASHDSGKAINVFQAYEKDPFFKPPSIAGSIYSIKSSNIGSSGKPPSVGRRKHSKKSSNIGSALKPPSVAGSTRSKGSYKKVDSTDKPPSVAGSRRSQGSYKRLNIDKPPSVAGSRRSKGSYRKLNSTDKPPSVTGSRHSRHSYKRYYTNEKPESVAESKRSRNDLDKLSIIDQGIRLGRIERLKSKYYYDLPEGTVRAPGWYIKGNEMCYIMLVSKQEELLERLAHPNSNACLLNDCFGIIFRAAFCGEDVICFKIGHLQNDVDHIERAVRSLQLHGLPEVAPFTIFTHRNLMTNGPDGKLYEELARAEGAFQTSKISYDDKGSAGDKSLKSGDGRKQPEDRSKASSRPSKTGSTGSKRSRSGSTAGVRRPPESKSTADSRPFGSNKSTAGSKPPDIKSTEGSIKPPRSIKSYDSHRSSDRSKVGSNKPSSKQGSIHSHKSERF